MDNTKHAKIIDSPIEGYEIILKKYGISYTANHIWLDVRNCDPKNKWLLFISVFGEHAGKMINVIAPLLDSYSAAFRIIKNEALVNQNNGFIHGINEAGKILTIYPNSNALAILLAKEIDKLSSEFSGPVVANCIRIGKVLYTSYSAENVNSQIEHKNIPIYNSHNGQKCPFKIHKKYKIKRRQRIIGKYYIPIKQIRFNAKGDTILGVNMKNLAFSKCLIKQARHDSFSDKYGRTAIHKLFWQKKVIELLQDHIPVPRILDLSRLDDDYYLITEYISEETLFSFIFSHQPKLKWYELDKHFKIELLKYYLQAVQIVKDIHSLGFIHRDLQVHNFLINNEKLFIIDFELAYSINDRSPLPAFSYGTIGFMSPEQTASEVPTKEQDIYSMGAILSFIIIKPKGSFEFHGNIYDQLVDARIEKELLNLIVKCLDEDSVSRPSLIEIECVIINTISVLENEHNQSKKTPNEIQALKVN